MTPEKRLEAIRRMVEQRPDDPFARYSLAMALRSTGCDQDAALELEELRRRAPSYVPTYLMLGRVLEALGESADAARAYQEGIAAAAQAGEEHARNELAQSLAVLRARET